jgi:hypothetical protein
MSREVDLPSPGITERDNEEFEKAIILETLRGLNIWMHILCIYICNLRVVSHHQISALSFARFERLGESRLPAREYSNECMLVALRRLFTLDNHEPGLGRR